MHRSLGQTAPASTQIYTLSLLDALPISAKASQYIAGIEGGNAYILLETAGFPAVSSRIDRKSTRLNSSHRTISYAAFCLKKKNPLLNNPTIKPNNTESYGHGFGYGCGI